MLLLVATLRNIAQKTKAAHQQHILQQCQDIAEALPSDKPNVQPVDIPQPFEDTWSPYAFSRGGGQTPPLHHLCHTPHSKKR